MATEAATQDRAQVENRSLLTPCVQCSNSRCAPFLRHTSLLVPCSNRSSAAEQSCGCGDRHRADLLWHTCLCFLYGTHYRGKGSDFFASTRLQAEQKLSIGTPTTSGLSEARTR